MKADHLKPDTYMKNDKDLMIEELKVSAQPLPTLCVGTCMWEIASQRGDHIWGNHTWGLHTTCSCSSGSSWKIFNDTGRSHLGAVPSPSPPPPSPSPPPPWTITLTSALTVPSLPSPPPPSLPPHTLPIRLRHSPPHCPCPHHSPHHHHPPHCLPSPPLLGLTAIALPTAAALPTTGPPHHRRVPLPSPRLPHPAAALATFASALARRHRSRLRVPSPALPHRPHPRPPLRA
jgi:hypothetical protein